MIMINFACTMNTMQILSDFKDLCCELLAFVIASTTYINIDMKDQKHGDGRLRIDVEELE